MNSDEPRPFAGKAFIADVDTVRSQKDSSWRDVAREVGVSPSTLTRLRQGTTPDLDTFSRLCAWAKLPTDRYIGNEDSATSETTPLAGISALLRSDKSLDSSGVEVMEAMIRATYEKFRQTDR